ncbi:MAG TPA: hypothetical protein VLH40_06795 [Atribacteraceae bacterium]|nr:hypothetical protein [Atribacteraceae bacterium]
MLYWFVLPGLIALILVGIGGFPDRPLPYQPVTTEAVVRFGDVLVDPEAGEIRFDGEIRQPEGWVRFLVYLASYQWLQEEAAIVSPANLSDLQKAIALLDWRLWDGLWHRETTGQEVDVFLQWSENKADANELIQLPDRLGIGDLIFLGSPLFDPLFLDRCEQTVVCVALAQRDRCPLLFLQQSVKEKFTRPGGEAGYHLNSERLPLAGSKVTVIIRITSIPEVG